MKAQSILWLGLMVAVATLGTALVSTHAAAVQSDAASVEVATGDDEAKTEEAQVEGSDSKGKYYFKKTCKTCHGKDGEGGEVTPISKTIKQWERVFKKDKHFEEEKLSETFDAIQLIHIKTFLIDHAADSDQPETCG
jgi:cytochrome c5